MALINVERLEIIQQCSNYYTNSDVIQELLTHIKTQDTKIEQLEKDKVILKSRLQDAEGAIRELSLYVDDITDCSNITQEAIDNAGGNNAE